MPEMFTTISAALGVQWAPLVVPLQRRLQTLAAAAWICLVLFGEAVAIFLYLKLAYSYFWWIAVIYAVWMLNDIEVCNRGGRRFEWVRNWAWWRLYRDYFPLRLVKTTELDPSKNYLFACFPHGVVSSGAIGTFATNALDFNKTFPGMTSHLITLGGHFLVPFFRDLVLALGACSSSHESLMYLLDRKRCLAQMVGRAAETLDSYPGEYKVILSLLLSITVYSPGWEFVLIAIKSRHTGRCVALMVGGAAEALDSHPGEYTVILSRRKGFIRIAIKSGAPLVPVFSFGEPDVFRPLSNPPQSLTRRLQERVRSMTGIAPVFPIGRGLLQYSFGVLPLRAPVTTVVGSPMEVQRNPEPTDAEVDAVHAEFTKKLQEMFEQEKTKYLSNYQDIRLVIT